MSQKYYAATNEDLRTIVTALAPAPEDTILAVCGSGDQAVALALHGAHVICVDVNSAQLDYAQRRYACLVQGDTRSFLLPQLNTLNLKQDEESLYQYLLPKRNGYFLAQPHFGMVSHLGTISFERKDIAQAIAEHTECSKVYLSNALHDMDMRTCTAVVEAALIRSNVHARSPLYYDTRALATIQSQLRGSEKRIRTRDSLRKIGIFRDVTLFFARKEFYIRSSSSWTPATYRIVAE